ncbi:MAG TPA: fumarylacetoacetate hydrolase family protein [Ferrovibrio sp.]|uniref:2-keto-4-pentenoate hydratase n=1 Tax=Ferrovibrio sp. TaxID=1917215 RepID=UPI002B4B3DCF|nr:fumarylacetoacetate hydrolase family protein [Ferrovibrio sp.]HLT78239.1 fumarylacetoacetate hydrolase family protein [Ferrovibrio sp.]
MKVKAVIDAAARLRQAEESGTPCANLRDLFDAEDIAAAYAVQTANRDHWLKAGRRPVGRKIALSAKGAQAMFRTTEPAYGMLYADMLLGDGDEVAKGRVLQPRLEGEVAMVLDRDLDMEEPTLVDVLRAVGYCLPAIEIVGCRIASLDTKLVDLVADNAGGGLFVLGGPARKLDGLDLRRMTMVMTKNGEQVAQGTGANVAGSPLNALAWLAARLVTDGQPLKAGDVVMTGTYFAMQPAAPGDQIEVIAEGLGRCSVSFAA